MAHSYMRLGNEWRGLCTRGGDRRIEDIEVKAPLHRKFNSMSMTSRAAKSRRRMRGVGAAPFP